MPGPAAPAMAIFLLQDDLDAYLTEQSDVFVDQRGPSAATSAGCHKGVLVYVARGILAASSIQVEWYGSAEATFRRAASLP